MRARRRRYRVRAEHRHELSAVACAPAERHFSDAAGWSAGPWYYATIRFPDVNGDGRADVCGRGAGGVVCALSTASSFTPAVAPLWAGAYSDAGGWAAGPQYYGTIQFP